MYGCGRENGYVLEKKDIPPSLVEEDIGVARNERADILRGMQMCTCRRRFGDAVKS